MESHKYYRRYEAWVGWLKVDTDWQVNSPIVLTVYDEKGDVMEYNGGKMIFNGIIEVKKENKEITYSSPEKMAGIEKESYVLDEIDAGTTCVTFTKAVLPKKKLKTKRRTRNN